MSWGKRASIIVERLFTAPRFASLSSEHPGRMGATMLGGVKRRLLAMLALALRVAPVPLRAFDFVSACGIWEVSGRRASRPAQARGSTCLRRVEQRASGKRANSGEGAGLSVWGQSEETPPVFVKSSRATRPQAISH